MVSQPMSIFSREQDNQFGHQLVFYSKPTLTHAITATTAKQMRTFIFTSILLNKSQSINTLEEQTLKKN